jgi:hypothetical protein
VTLIGPNLATLGENLLGQRFPAPCNMRASTATSFSAYIPVSLTQIAEVPPSTTSSLPLT